MTTALPRSRTERTRWIIQCMFEDGRVLYPTGHGSHNGDTIMLFSENPEDALCSHIGETLFMGWTHLLKAHMRNTGEQLKARVIQVHRINSKWNQQ